MVRERRPDQDAAVDSGTRVGEEIDLLYRYEWTEKATIEGGYARFEPGEFAEASRGPSVSHWGYLGLTVRI